jgi:isopentenyl-diphosphate delta-isomerase type 1
LSTTAEPMHAVATARPGVEHVVLVDRLGRPNGTVAKSRTHDRSTPLHLAFSCHIVGPDGTVLVTRRAPTKATWPSTWTNGCCGHPQLGETLRSAVTRRIDEELGLTVRDARLAIADFAYRAVMDDGTAEHELCPVVVVAADGELRPDPDEVGAFEWVPWDQLVRRAEDQPGSLSPWCVEQVRQMVDRGITPSEWLAAPRPRGHDAVLDEPIELGADRTSGVPPSASRRRSSELDPLGQVAADLRPVLDEFLEARSAELVAIDPSLSIVAEEIRGLVDAGGKRLRPAFVYWGHRATGAAHDPAVLRPAAAVELLHTFALLHDDVMDRSATRRGRPCAHVAMAAHHDRTAATGDGAWFGVSAATLIGDMAYVWSDQLFDSSGIDADVLARARQVFTSLRSEVIAGQYLDLALTGSVDAGELDARRVAVLKSARYTVTRPLLLGAALDTASPADPELLDSLRAYGDAVGLAFQMRDDVLGIFGDPSVTGKSTLDDLREGKRTVLVLRALRLADPSGREVLRSALGDDDLDEHAAERCRDVISSSGALASVERLVAHEHACALAAIEPLGDPARHALETLAATAIQRWS